MLGKILVGMTATLGTALGCVVMTALAVIPLAISVAIAVVVLRWMGVIECAVGYAICGTPCGVSRISRTGARCDAQNVNTIRRFD